MLASILWAAMAAAGITAAIVSGIGWLREQPQPALPLLQGVSTEQLLRSLEVGGLWMLVVGIFIVLISMPGKNYSG